ncbi:MAG: DUF2497 domain-containing protein [Geminicoccaceae bacterium]
MSQARSDQEPSMEEILSSIRKIIADEGAEKPAPPAATAPAPAKAAAPPPAVEDDDVLELTDIADDEPAETPAPASLDAGLVARPATPASAPPPLPKENPPMPTIAKDDGLVSPTAASASANAFAKLARATGGETAPSPLAGRSVEDLLVELLRPALKEWLDQNLPAVVERVVEQEVKKLARRAELM